MVGAKERVRILEMSSSMIWFQVSILEEAMEIDPPLTDLTSEGDSTDLEYQDVDDGGTVLVEDLEDKRENMPPVIALAVSPHSFPFTRLQYAQLDNDPYLSFLKPSHEIT
jgi:hypothetical protein